MIAVHQPFTYSRTKMLMNDFAEVLSQADQVVLLPVMGGREADDGSVRSEQLAAKLPGSVVVDGLEGAAEWVKQNARAGRSGGLHELRRPVQSRRYDGE